MRRSLKILLSVLILMSFIATSLGFTSIAVKSIKLNATSANLTVGKTFSLKATFTPANATNKKVTFSSANNSIATVSSSGNIKGIKAGKTVITVTSLSNKKAIVSCNVTVSLAAYDSKNKIISLSYAGVNPPFVDGSWGQKYLEEKFKLKINVVRIENDNYMATLNLRLASGFIPDLMALPNPTEYGSVAMKNLLAEIPEDTIKKNMPKYYEMALKMDANIFKYTKVNGKNYGVPTVSATGSWNLPIAMRADWIKNVGGSIPKSLQEYEDLFVKFRENDPDKNGKKDTYAITTPTEWGAMYMFTPIFGAFGTNPGMWFNRDGKLVHGFTEPGTKEALKVLAKWYKKQLIDPEFITNKARTNSNDDISFKFATGRVGYIDHHWFDDHPNDNDGQISGKWVANNPEWKKWFEDHKGKPDANSLKSMTTLDAPAGFPQPFYVNVKPPVGPGGKSGTMKPGVSGGRVYALSNKVNTEKMNRVLTMFEELATDEETFFSMMGPEGKQWVYSEDKTYRLTAPTWKTDADYHPQGRKLGTGWWLNPFLQSNPKLLKGWGKGHPALQQRYNLCANIDGVAVGFPGIENALKGSLPSANKYSEIANGIMVTEYIVKAVTGAVNIDTTYDDAVKEWKENGGDILTKEANNWLQSIK